MPSLCRDFIENNQIENKQNMLNIPVKEGESIERALKRYKKKFDRTKVLRQLRARKQFDKPSVLRRQEMIKATYVEGLRREEM